MRKVQQGFVAGEFSPQMYGRFDDTKYAQGLALCRNFITLPQGPATVRPGFAFVRAVKFSDKPTRIIPFTWSLEQTMVIELGDHYARFHTLGQTLLDEDGDPYEIATPYAAEDVFGIHYVQSMDVMTLAHPNYAPRELKRYGAYDWRLEEINFEAPLNPPVISSVTYEVVAGSGATITDEEKTRYTLRYKVTAVRDTDTGMEESAASSMSSTQGNLYLNNATVTITWGAVTGAQRYRVFKNYKGLYCYIGETDETSFVDDNYEPDASITPPIYESPFLQNRGITSVDVLAQGNGYSAGLVEGVSGWPTCNTSYGSGSANSLYLYWYNPSAGTNSTPVHENVVPDSGITIRISDPTGAGAVVKPLVRTTGSGRYISATLTGFKVVNPGSGYTAPKMLLTVTPGLNFNDDNVVSGYTDRYHYTFVDANGNRRRDTTNNHTEYQTLDISGAAVGGVTLRVSDSTGSGARLRANLSDGKIVSVTVVQGGSGYSNPTITAVTSTGSGASFKANLGGSGDYPGAVCYFEQRRCFAGSPNRPQMVWMTKTGTESNMSYTIPSQADNRIRFRLAAQEASRILHMLPLSHLILLTNSTEYRAASGITPTDIDVKPQSYVGASDVQPVLVNSTLVYASARDGHMRELGYNWQSSGFTTGDLSVRATHLFEADRVVDMGLQKSPDPIVWAVMASGTLVGLTYMPEQSVSGWHKHVTQNGAFESVAVVAEGNEDIVYCVVRREINGETVRYVERMHERLVSSLFDSFFVDCGGTYRGDPTTEISGLSWLEGQTVSILADGCVLPRQTVQSGKVTIPMEASVVHVGLPITADLQTLPVAVQMSDGSYYQGHMKNINEVWTRVYQSSGLFVGPDFDHLIEAKQRTTEPYGSPPDLMNREVSVVAAPAWTDSGQICIRQSDPLPLTIVSVSFELAE